MAIDLQQTNGLRSMAVERGGGRIALTGVDLLRVRDARGALLAPATTERRDGHAALAFTRTGAVVGGKGNVIDVLENGVHSRIEGKFDAARSPIRCLAEVAPGVVVTGHADGALRRVDLTGRKFERVGYKLEARSITTIACGPTSGTFVTAGERVLAEWHESERTPRAQHKVPGWALALDVTHRRVLSTGSGGLVRSSWDGSERVAIPGKSYEPKAAFLESGALAVTLDSGELVVLAPSGELLARHEDPTRPSALAVDGETIWIVRGRSLASITIAERTRFTRREISARHAAPVSRLLPLTRGFASHASDQAVKLWSPDGSFAGGIRLEAGIDAAAVSRSALLLGTSRGELVTIDPQSGATRAAVTLGRFRVWAIAGPDDERWIAGVDLGRDHALFHRGKKRAAWRRRGPAQTMAWSESRRVLLFPSGGTNGVIVLGEDGEPRGTVRPSTSALSVSVSPDGAHFACAHGTGAAVYSLDDLEAAPRTVCVVPEESGFSAVRAWSGNDALWLSRGSHAFCVSIESGETLRELRGDDRITAVLDLGDAVAIGTERGDVLVRTPVKTSR